MGVLEIHRATQVLLRIPSDIIPLITEFIGITRLDWRTCKKKSHESFINTMKIVVDYDGGEVAFLIFTLVDSWTATDPINCL